MPVVKFEKIWFSRYVCTVLTIVPLKNPTPDKYLKLSSALKSIRIQAEQRRVIY